jgi:parallel beta-helix repeat protein
LQIIPEFPKRFHIRIMRLWNTLRNLLAIANLILLIIAIFLAIDYVKSSGLPPRLFILKAVNKIGMESSFIAKTLTPQPLKPVDIVFPSLNSSDWQGHGAREDRKLAPVIYDSVGRPVPHSWTEGKETSISPEGETRIVPVQNSEELLKAVRQALPGDIITLKPGKYPIRKRSIYVSLGGNLMQPITVRAERLGDVFLELDSLEGFVVNSPYWIFENLDIQGVCNDDEYCEHAFHVVGNGPGFVLRNNRIHEFNSPIKANRIKKGDAPRIGPHGVLLEGNSFYNTRARQTNHPVSFIDVVGVNHFIVSNNVIADFQKAKGDQISYAAQIKGNSAYGVYERNLVLCEYQTSGGIRVGLSFGGGGTGKQFLEPGDIYEHSKGIVRNNIVMYCSDVGLYLNKAHETKVFNNTFYRTNGVDIRFPESTALIANNLVSGKIWDRNDATSERRNNLVRANDRFLWSFKKDFTDWFVDPAAGNFVIKDGKDIIDKGENSNLIWEDFCGNKRDGLPDIGAIEFGNQDTCLPIPEMK